MLQPMLGLAGVQSSCWVQILCSCSPQQQQHLRGWPPHPRSRTQQQAVPRQRHSRGGGAAAQEGSHESLSSCCMKEGITHNQHNHLGCSRHLAAPPQLALGVRPGCSSTAATDGVHAPHNHQLHVLLLLLFLPPVQALKINVDMLKLIQLGLTFTDAGAYAATAAAGCGSSSTTTTATNSSSSRCTQRHAGLPPPAPRFGPSSHGGTPACQHVPGSPTQQHTYARTLSHTSSRAADPACGPVVPVRVVLLVPALQRATSLCAMASTLCGSSTSRASS